MARPLKDLYTRRFIRALANELRREHPPFDASAFEKRVFAKGWADLELKDRMHRIAAVLREFLPGDYGRAIAILRPVAGKFSGFEAMVFPDFVEQHGLGDYGTSVSALEHFTKFSSSEFAVRPFLVRYGGKMLKQMERWARSKDRHVRRLASEGCRPRLPWAMALPDFKKDPGPVLRILELLKDDEDEAVRRSVANNLNDISKDHPDIVLEVARKWRGGSKARGRLVKHACRTLLKRGDRRALELFGFGEAKHVRLVDFRFSKRVAMGRDLEFSFTLETDRGKLGALRLEYEIGFVKANGDRSGKVFRISESECSGKMKRVSKRHSFRAISTRRHYAGRHRLAILVNGREVGQGEFTLFGS